jgi:hypothetical protein
MRRIRWFDCTPAFAWSAAAIVFLAAGCATDRNRADVPFPADAETAVAAFHARFPGASVGSVADYRFTAFDAREPLPQCFQIVSADPDASHSVAAVFTREGTPIWTFENVGAKGLPKAVHQAVDRELGTGGEVLAISVTLHSRIEYALVPDVRRTVLAQIPDAAGVSVLAFDMDGKLLEQQRVGLEPALSTYSDDVASDDDENPTTPAPFGTIEDAVIQRHRATSGTIGECRWGDEVGAGCIPCYSADGEGSEGAFQTLVTETGALLHSVRGIELRQLPASVRMAVAEHTHDADKVTTWLVEAYSEIRYVPLQRPLTAYRITTRRDEQPIDATYAPDGHPIDLLYSFTFGTATPERLERGVQMPPQPGVRPRAVFGWTTIARATTLR